MLYSTTIIIIVLFHNGICLVLNSTFQAIVQLLWSYRSYTRIVFSLLPRPESTGKKFTLFLYCKRPNSWAWEAWE